jgi:hypothetical protein
MGVSRRTVLKVAGATVVVAGGTVAARAWQQGVFSVGQGPAYDPWRRWRADQPEGPTRLVRAAILAANPHNSQPWLFRVHDTIIDVFADTERNIGAIDPYRREMYVGLGCALENLVLAAERYGYAADVTLLPDAANAAHAARVALVPSTPQESALFEAIPMRHTDRGPYDTARAVSGETLTKLAGLGTDLSQVTVLWFTTEPDRRRVGELIVAATEAIVADGQQSSDSAKWFRSSWREIQQLRDGITLDAQSLPPFINAVAKILPPLSQEQSDQAWLRTTRDRHVATAAAFGLIVVPDTNNNAWRIRGGRLWQRMHLWATTQGLSMHPLNQMSERADREHMLGIEPRFGTALKELVPVPGMQALMPFRLGYPTMRAQLSPRRDVTAVLV